ncbi:chromophore lyase CpcT/CpeT [Nostoc sp. TCL26-01]|uniref:chromophore lyase CpcT/CpeT n=1 Tax=Nostoc sp. TCL26-01 TaxID=2576904 RepID=UPI0015BF4017|nr:chromophore lyase CpcT/CpeT [Nostoc sp. TCL26-01]QLE59689.1 CpeT/CpcT protein [Nostoc sp. TCL26-01]
MNKLKVYSLTFLLSVLVFPSRAVAFAPPLSTQVKEVAQWFTGFFDNAQQMASNPTTTPITMSNCSVQLDDGNLFSNSQNVYLEQQSTVFERIRFYSFSEGNSVVNLSIRSFLNSGILRGLCNQPEQQRIINISNIATTSCNLSLTWQENRYIGTNAPNGCPTSTGGKVVSNVTFFNNGVNSLDQIFTANGNLIVNTPIEFRRITSIPEPSFILGILALGIWGNAIAFLGKVKHKSTR